MNQEATITTRALSPLGAPQRVRWRNVLCCLSLVALVAPDVAIAQAWPTKPVRFLVGFSPGATTDLLARLFAKQLSQNTGQPFVVESKLGAGGAIAAQEVVRAQPDGYTLLVTTTSTHSVAPAMSTKLPYNTVTDFTPIAHLADSPLVMLASPTIGVKNVAELIALARAKPDSLNYSSSGVGTLGHLTTEAFKAQAGISMTHVPYKGSAQAIPDLMNGVVQITWDSIGTGLGPAKDGRVRALAVSGPRRSPLAPDLPAIAETVQGFSVVFWFGLYGPAGMSPQLTLRINEEVNKVLRSPEIVARFAELGIEAGRGSPVEFAAMVASDTARWTRVVSENKIKGE
jgi:tripartite-type tricarboxylate transporter receptor subunit TctC